MVRPVWWLGMRHLRPNVQLHIADGTEIQPKSNRDLLKANRITLTLTCRFSHHLMLDSILKEFHVDMLDHFSTLTMFHVSNIKCKVSSGSAVKLITVGTFYCILVLM